MRPGSGADLVCQRGRPAVLEATGRRRRDALAGMRALASDAPYWGFSQTHLQHVATAAAIISTALSRCSTSAHGP